MTIVKPARRLLGDVRGGVVAAIGHGRLEAAGQASSPSPQAQRQQEARSDSALSRDGCRRRVLVGAGEAIGELGRGAATICSAASGSAGRDRTRAGRTARRSAAAGWYALAAVDSVGHSANEGHARVDRAGGAEDLRGRRGGRRRTWSVPAGAGAAARRHRPRPAARRARRPGAGGRRCRSPGVGDHRAAGATRNEVRDGALGIGAMADVRCQMATPSPSSSTLLRASSSGEE